MLQSKIFGRSFYGNSFKFPSSFSSSSCFVPPKLKNNFYSPKMYFFIFIFV
ncbi:unnamed protein product [Meloidogyne enterolobii]|uniref:Uncharacterized protein n=1 Tax=Meloidogyne enterolobii TaxID=390850 RepID=A0ACB1AS48_MELEN